MVLLQVTIQGFKILLSMALPSLTCRFQGHSKWKENVKNHAWEIAVGRAEMAPIGVKASNVVQWSVEQEEDTALGESWLL